MGSPASVASDSQAARERFLGLVDHRPEDHLAGNPFPPKVVARFEKEPRRRAIATTPAEDCSLWWCKWRDNVSPGQWHDLERAAQTLKDKGRALHDEQAQRILLAHLDVELWRAQAKDLESLATANETVALTPGGYADGLREDLMRHLEPFLRAARAAAPKRSRLGPPSDVAFTRALEVAEAKGWGAGEIAALLLLIGFDRSDWKSLKDKVAKKIRKRRESGKRLT